jgi:putative pyruvate formate lyase activating enzyme
MSEHFSVDSKIAILEKNIPIALEYFSDCTVCPRQCHIDRTSGELGECGMPARLKISSANLHFGEEPPISGTAGSGTIFLSGCNLHCQYCQNYPISQYGHGKFYSPAETANMMLSLQGRGAHNINFVTPTHYVPALMEALLPAYRNGLQIPLVYNSSGYDSLEMLRLLDGIIDIYMPDMRYDDANIAAQLSDVPDYPPINRAAIKEMHRQVGVLKTIAGVARRGLLIRHLVLPGNLAGSNAIFNFIVDKISPETYISVMSQYFPAYNACRHNQLDRRLTAAEYEAAVDAFEKAGLGNGYIQPYHP